MTKCSHLKFLGNILNVRRAIFWSFELFFFFFNLKVFIKIVSIKMFQLILNVSPKQMPRQAWGKQFGVTLMSRRHTTLANKSFGSPVKDSHPFASTREILLT